MLKYLIIAVCLLTLISCDENLYKASPGDTTLSEVETISADTNYYKILIQDEVINIYSMDNKLVYKDCVSVYNNDIIPIPAGAVILILIFIIVLLLFLMVSINN